MQNGREESGVLLTAVSGVRRRRAVVQRQSVRGHPARAQLRRGSHRPRWRACGVPGRLRRHRGTGWHRVLGG
eukprot:2928070-Rhodomonas_salina.1